MGAVFFQVVDERVAETGLLYARFLDDWVIRAPTRWKLRRAARIMQQTLAELKGQTHPDKTFLGRTARGFDFLGYRFGPDGLTGVAEATVQRFVEKANGLDAQKETGNAAAGELPACLSALALGVMAAATAPGTGTPPSAEKGMEAATEEPGASECGPGHPPDERVPRLDEQAAPANPRSPGGLEGLAGRCGDYVRRWCRWVTSGLAGTRWAATLLLGGVGPDRRPLPRRAPRAPA